MKRLALLVAAGLSAGCANNNAMRMDGVTSGAGDAIAANTVMQMVDPWQAGVEDTELLIPAKRAAAAVDNSAETVSTEGSSSPVTTGN